MFIFGARDGKPARPESGTNWLRRAVTPGRYVSILILAALVALLMPRPSKDVQAVALTIVKGALSKEHADVALLGPSVVQHTSKCDRDPRSIAAMLTGAGRAGRVADLSYPGQPLILSIQLAALEAAYGKARDIILVTTHDAFLGWPAPPYSEWSLFLLTNPFLQPRVELASLDTWAGLTERLPRFKQSFTYQGVSYPKERVLFDEWFVYERSKTSCPETPTHDWRRLEAYTWRRQVEPAPNPALIRMLGDLAQDVRARGKTLRVVMLPINYELYSELNSAWPAAIEAHTRFIVKGLTTAGVPVLDLSLLLDSTEFSTLWCVCTHFNESGRRKVSGAIAREWFGAGMATRTSMKTGETRN